MTLNIHVQFQYLPHWSFQHFRNFSHLEIFHSWKLFFQISCENCVGSAGKLLAKTSSIMQIVSGGEFRLFVRKSLSFMADTIPHSTQLEGELSAKFTSSTIVFNNKEASFIYYREMPWSGRVVGVSWGRKLQWKIEVHKEKLFSPLPTSFRLNSVVSYVALTSTLEAREGKKKVHGTRSVKMYQAHKIA